MVVTPVYYGHMFINPKDIPFACGMVWSLYLMCRVMETLPRVPLRTALTLGVVLGLTLGTRIIGVLAGFYLAVALILYLALEARSGTAGANWPRNRPASCCRSCPCCRCSTWHGFRMAVVLAGTAEPDPRRDRFRQFSLAGSVLVNGVMIKATELPAYYLPLFMVTQLPELVLAGILAAAVMAVVWLARWRPWCRQF